jgi:hypothetical protein
MKKISGFMLSLILIASFAAPVSASTSSTIGSLVPVILENLDVESVTIEKDSRFRALAYRVILHSPTNRGTTFSSSANCHLCGARRSITFQYSGFQGGYYVYTGMLTLSCCT